jgi:beta-galactosidase
MIYSIGNEIRDSLATRTPIATNFVNICHTNDPTRPVTQALFRPMDSGDVTGATVGILDVFGANYRLNEVQAAIAMSPPHAGIMTEMGTSTSDWSMITATPAVTGEFIWTGVDYLGEAAGLWPVVGASSGVIDRVGTFKAAAYSYQSLWGTATSKPATGTNATKLVLTPDHAAIVTDLNDVSFVKATVADANGNVVTSASNAVTFSISGPGKIVAVDSGSVNAESFRGTQRMAFQGICYAIVQATGAGTITVTASATGLTGASANVQASAGTFVPCSGTCD